MKNKKQEIPEWFHGVIYNTGDTVENPFTGATAKLTAIELSVYDFIMGAQMFPTSYKVQNEVRKGLDWFIKENPDAYMALLD
jgi:hypothetical protein